MTGGFRKKLARFFHLRHNDEVNGSPFQKLTDVN
ncbi:hypothetical protein Cflav_PD5216 [Pedosphaera parvula Ellin514]|uniref:Uncharacterized protein n=1 Tax=Pedosphaera parvula (strain Ellin514) TaxID=320771 RepID=B9XCB3_PEDPL|nr:hypothetical protein Cflav_PD5216 [Pedosphaera parvula Ellin514]